MNGYYFFQTDSDAVPVFYINKETWCDNYKKIIHQCLDTRMCYLFVEPLQENLDRMVEIECLCRADFEKHYGAIDNLLGLNNNKINK